MFPSRRSLQKYGSVDLEIVELAQGGSLSHLPPNAQETEVRERQSSLPQDNSSHCEDTIEHLRMDINHGADFSRMVLRNPDKVTDALQKSSIIRLGKFTVPDVEMATAFGRHHMLTRGADAPDDENYERTWKNVISSTAKKSTFEIADGWRENRTLVAYAIDIRNAAAPLKDGVLLPLLIREQEHCLNNALWNFLSVQVIIEHKWYYWAKHYLIIEFILYMGWVCGFTGYLVIYIQKDLDQYMPDMNPEDLTFTILAFICDIVALIFMSPFLLIEFNSILYYRWNWFQMWNVIDACAYILQILISYFHFTRTIFRDEVYSTLLAVHCTVLFIKVQYFSRVMGVRTSYVETLRSLIYNVRYFLVFIVSMMISASLSFAVLYKEDIGVKEKKLKADDDEDVNESLDDFRSLPRSLVTTYAVLLGSFEPAYVFDTGNSVVKGAFFLIFQLLMSITILNLLIAVMTEAYVSIMATEKAVYNRSRAQLISELEITIPARIRPKMKPYIHFILEEGAELDATDEAGDGNKGEKRNTSDPEIKSELAELKEMIKKLQQDVASLHK